MIVTKLAGGLGNQMFQYAAGLRLAAMHGTGLALDVSALGDRTDEVRRAFELGAYRISAEVIEPAKAHSPSAAPLSRAAEVLSGLLRKSAGRQSNSLTPTRRERQFQFDPAVLELPDGITLQGYWQSERYFADVADQVRQDLTLRHAPTGLNAEVAAQIASCTAVSLHVRRGDYVSNAAHNSMHGVCELDYYERAIAYICERVEDPVCFLFSDDPAWVAAHLSLDVPTVLVDHNGPGAGREDLRLMSRCAHHVLANSSFSWWGAWLNPNTDKLVIAPTRWFRDASIDTRDLIPKGWVSL